MCRSKPTQFTTKNLHFSNENLQWFSSPSMDYGRNASTPWRFKTEQPFQRNSVGIVVFRWSSNRAEFSDHLLTEKNSKNFEKFLCSNGLFHRNGESIGTQKITSLVSLFRSHFAEHPQLRERADSQCSPQMFLSIAGTRPPPPHAASGHQLFPAICGQIALKFSSKFHLIIW